MKLNTTGLFLALSVTSALTSQAIAANRVNLDDGAEQNQLISISELVEQHQFETTASVTLNHDISKTKLQQMYKGIPVYGESLVSTVSASRSAETFSGELITGIEQDLADVIPSISENESVSILAQHWNHDLIKVSQPEKKLVVWLDKKDTAHLAWQVSYVVYAKAPSRPYAFIDAKSGAILDTWDAIAFAQGTGPGGNTKTGRYHFGTDYPSFNIAEINGSCYLDSPNVETLDMKHQTVGGAIHTFNCYENTSREVNGAYSPMNDAHAFGQVVFNMFKDWYQTAPLTQKLRLRVHYGSSYENAFWDGRQMTFGDGATRFYPLVSLDVVAHEVSHGFTQQNSNLEYKNQSGGMNEAFSDISAAAAVYYHTGSFNWKIGDEIFKGAGSMRYMNTPSLDGKSIDHAKDYYQGLNVHYSSGVYNRAFYLLANTSGWDIRKAFNAYVLANQIYWTPRSTYDQGAVGVVKAAVDLGYCVDDIVYAFNKVGVNAGALTGQGCKDVPADRPPLAAFDVSVSGKQVTVTDRSSDDKGVVAHQWSFGDGATSTQPNTAHTYNAAGSYTVTLTVTDGIGQTHSSSQSVTIVDNGNCTAPLWNASTVYLQGDKVSQAGKNYEAKWWTQGEDPTQTGAWGSWRDLGVCP
ncbi:PKD domain-containing protein [Vibrio sp. S9_S30]|uniref:M4 family metallopeptidase n=1 Tax=Vibrio sp. S9_S30 TaxID=2720226 RepID=UPI001681AB33|nr:M4 family metallopeptidase [Vibrio sp. S9_S30]MBD1558555.1 PKD domain-containing protein [Vibrio sp. S9_S30]